MSLTAERVRQVLRYDARTGIFRWKVTLSNRARAGAVAGSKGKDGYWGIGLFGRRRRAHRIAWLYVTGNWPRLGLDHKNRDPLDNRFDNLREATDAMNHQNRSRAGKRSRTGVLGVSPVEGGKYRASIKIGGKQFNLGHFPNVEAARSAYLDAKRRLHPGAVGL